MVSYVGDYNLNLFNNRIFFFYYKLYMPSQKSMRRGIKRNVKANRRHLRARRKTLYRQSTLKGTVPYYPFKRDYYCTLKYNDTFILSSTLGSTAVQIYSLNSLFDTDVTGVGHQPRYYDTLCGADGGSAPYGSYRVITATVSVRFMNNNASTNSIGYVGMRPRLPTATLTSSVAYPNELPHVSYTMLNVSTGMSNYKVMKRTFKMSTIIGCKDIKDNEDSSAAYNASPVQQVYLDLFYFPRDAATSATIQCDIFLHYNVQFFDLNGPASS